MSISVVLVLYNCEHDFLNRIFRPIVDSVYEFIVVANSELSIDLGFKFGVDEFFLNRRIIFIQNDENMGIAAAQNSGVAAASGDFILFFDQDSLLDCDIAKLLYERFLDFDGRVFQSDFEIGLISGIDCDERTQAVNSQRVNNGSEIYNSGVFNVLNTLSSSSLIRRDLFLRVGGNNEWLFIDQVDNDLCYRLRYLGFMVLIDTEAKFYHNLGEGHQAFLWRQIGVSSPFRNYYQFRNMLFLLSKPYVRPFEKLKLVRSILFKVFAVIVLWDQRCIRLAFSLRGIRDGFTSWFFRGGS